VACLEPGRGETILLFTEDAALRRDQLAQAARSLGAPEIALPRKIVWVREIPLLGNGKTDYAALERLAANGAPPAPA